MIRYYLRTIESNVDTVALVLICIPTKLNIRTMQEGPRGHNFERWQIQTLQASSVLANEPGLVSGKNPGKNHLFIYKREPWCMLLDIFIFFIFISIQFYSFLSISIHIFIFLSISIHIFSF